MSDYILKQYCHTSTTGDDDNFNEQIPLSSDCCKSFRQAGDRRIDDPTNFTAQVDQGFTYNFEPGINYYCRCCIRRNTYGQTIGVNISLANCVQAAGGESWTIESEQFIKNVNIASDDKGSQCQVSFIFNPMIAFNSLIFRIVRDTYDLTTGPRSIQIIYQELDEIKTRIVNERHDGIKKLMKLGVQSRPGLAMCINGEEIHTSRAGIYELNNGVLPVTFFSVVCPRVNTPNTQEDFETIQNQINAQCNIIDADYKDGKITKQQRAMAYQAIQGQSIMDKNKTAKIDDFILDYIYEK